MAQSNFTIAVIPGDGIGQEVVPAALHVLDALAERSAGGWPMFEPVHGSAPDITGTGIWPTFRVGEWHQTR